MKIHSKNYLYDPSIGNFLSWFIGALIMSPYINGWSTSPILVVLGFFVASIWTIWLHAYRQAYQIEIRKKPINHKKAVTIRVVVVVIISILSHLLIVGVTKEAILPMMACAIYLGSIFWLLFDFFINAHRKKRWDYRGNSAKTDKAFKEKKAFWITSKIVLFVFATLLYYRSLVGF